eukprot:716068-Amorphochlora_amoeboformis.AAC.1
MDDFFSLKTEPRLDGLEGLEMPKSPALFGNPGTSQHPTGSTGETKTSELGAEKKRPHPEGLMLDSKNNHQLAKLPAHLQMASQSEWSPHCPGFMSAHSWRGIHQELRKDLKVGEWAYSCSSEEMWWSMSVHKIFESSTPYSSPSFETYRSLLHPDDRDQVLFLFQRAITRGIPYDVTHRLYLPNKTIKWCRCMCRIQFHSISK